MSEELRPSNISTDPPVEPEPTPPPAPRHEEHHITVAGDPIKWYGFCRKQKIKPLYIELNNRNLQLMCAVDGNDPRIDIGILQDAMTDAGFTVLRHKHEVSELREGEKPLYWECHVKIDGVFRTDFGLTSRDLYRTNRWYVTRRLQRRFDGDAFAELIRRRLQGKQDQRYDSFEYEACIVDTNPGLDKGWDA